MKRNSQDAKFSKEMRTLRGFTCQRCGKEHVENSMGLHCCHIFSRAILRLRYDPDNVLVCCNGCHRHIDSYADAKESLARQVLGDEGYEALRLRAHTPSKRVSPGCTVSNPRPETEQSGGASLLSQGSSYQPVESSHAIAPKSSDAE